MVNLLRPACHHRSDGSQAEGDQPSWEKTTGDAAT